MSFEDPLRSESSRILNTFVSSKNTSLASSLLQAQKRVFLFSDQQCGSHLANDICLLKLFSENT